MDEFQLLFQVCHSFLTSEELLERIIFVDAHVMKDFLRYFDQLEKKIGRVKTGKDSSSARNILGHQSMSVWAEITKIESLYRLKRRESRPICIECDRKMSSTVT